MKVMAQPHGRILFALSFLLFLPLAGAQTPAPKPKESRDKAPVVRETYRDLISKAQNLSIQKDRLQATKILVRATQKEKGPGRKELIQALRELSEVFYSEKGQQVFELGRSFEESTPQGAIDRFNDSLTLEPGNTAVIRALSRTHLVLNQCDKALDLAVQGLGINPFDEELALYRSQATVCLGRSESIKLNQELSELTSPALKPYLEVLRVKTLLNEGKLQAAEALTEKALAADPRFPELHLQAALIKQKLKKDSSESFQKYLSLCAELSAEKKRKFKLEPRLCLEKTKAEAELEKIKPSQTPENN